MMRGTALLLLLLATVALAGCGGAGGGSTTGTRTPSATTGTVTSAAPPARTAADAMAAYFDAATRMDRQLTAAARLVNGGIHADGMNFDHATLDTIAAIDPAVLAGKIPAGLPPALERRVLLVQSELVSRRAAFNYVTRVVTDRSHVMHCLAQGAPAAARFTADLAAARELAARTPLIAIAAPASRSAADLAVTLRYIEGVNICCGSCGGTVLTELPRISWASAHSSNGTITVTVPSTRATVTIPFTARYVPGSGWAVQLRAG